MPDDTPRARLARAVEAYTGVEGSTVYAAYTACVSVDPADLRAVLAELAAAEQGREAAASARDQARSELADVAHVLRGAGWQMPDDDATEVDGVLWLKDRCNADLAARRHAAAALAAAEQGRAAAAARLERVEQAARRFLALHWYRPCNGERAAAWESLQAALAPTAAGPAGGVAGEQNGTE